MSLNHPKIYIHRKIIIKWNLCSKSNEISEDLFDLFVIRVEVCRDMGNWGRYWRISWIRREFFVIYVTGASKTQSSGRKVCCFQEFSLRKSEFQNRLSCAYPNSSNSKVFSYLFRRPFQTSPKYQTTSIGLYCKINVLLQMCIFINNF